MSSTKPQQLYAVRLQNGNLLQWDARCALYPGEIAKHTRGDAIQWARRLQGKIEKLDGELQYTYAVIKLTAAEAGVFNPLTDVDPQYPYAVGRFVDGVLELLDYGYPSADEARNAWPNGRFLY